MFQWPITSELQDGKKYLPTCLISRPMHPGPAVSTDIFFDLQLLPLTTLQLLDQNQCLVPHFKDLFHICLEPEAQGHGMNFSVCNVSYKYT